MKKYLIKWKERVTQNCSVVVEADSDTDAIEKFHDGEFDETDAVKDEVDCYLNSDYPVKAELIED